MEKQGKYIYGFLNSGKELFFGPHGISACEEVYTVSYQDISAVVSDSEIADYTCMHTDSLAMFLVRHQRAIEKIMGLGHTIIPMRLGTFAKDTGEIQYILSCGYSIIKDIFSKISDRIEIDIIAEWSDFSSTLKEIGEDEEIKKFKERLLTSPAGVTVDDRMKVGFMVKEALERKREGYSQQIRTTLKSVSQDFKTHELMNDKMVTNIAFLIDKPKQDTFYKRVEELNAKFKEELNFRCVGPLPPYSFYTLEIKTINNEEIDWA
ncbi:MAG: GvpL/GvpF family gas vesicle protein, partial [Candidatus Omnitrophota bacterium]